MLVAIDKNLCKGESLKKFVDAKKKLNVSFYPY
jgi:hypothetical protein